MHARELHTSSLQAEHDDRREPPQGSAPQPPPAARTAESLRGAGDILSKVETPKMRPCGVIAPERTQRPLSPLGQHLPNRQPWPVMDASTYKYVAPQNSSVEYVYPQRNISPRQTFQENMPRILVPLRSDLSKIISEPTAPLTSYPYQPSQEISKNSSTDPKYCAVPYVASQIPKQQRTSVVRNNEIYASNVGVPPPLTRSWQSSVPPTPTAYYPSDYYHAHHQNYSTSAAHSTKLPTKKSTDQLQQAHGENLYRGEARFEPYPPTKDKYPRARYDYVNFPNSYHPYIPPQQKYDSTKPVATPVYVNYTPQKYVDPRIVDPRIIDSHPNTYIRPSQYLPSYTAPHTDYMSTKFAAPATPYQLQSKFYGHQFETGPRQANSTAKGSYDPRSCFEQEYGRRKPLQVNESSYMTEIPPYGFRGQVALSNYHLNNAQHRAINYMYQQRLDNSVKNYGEILPQYKYADIRTSAHNPLARIPTQFSPNVISPSESNTSNESVPPQGTHEDCGYVSQSSNNSGKSLDCSSRYKLQQYEPNTIDYRPYQMMSKRTIKPLERSNSGVKNTRNIDIRQFLQTWDEDDEGDTTKAKDNFPGSHKPTENITVDAAVIPSTSEQPLYVLGCMNIPNEEIDKYEHIQKICKLPENIRGYDNADLLNKFDEAFRPASFINPPAKTSNYSQNVINAVSETLTSNIVGTARPPSPFDIESKITQSVIHKDVGCNFEIKPFSPPVQNLKNSSVMQNNNERKIEKIVNPIMQSTTPNALQHTGDSTQGTANKRYLSSDEPITNNKVMKTIDSHSNIKNRETKRDDIGRDYDTVSGVCLASLPRLDNEMDLNFQEINDQYNHLKDNQESVIITTINNSSLSVHERTITENDSADFKIINEHVAKSHADGLLPNDETCIYDYDQALTMLSSESSDDKSTTKLSKIRKNKLQNNMETITSQSYTSTSMPQSSPVQRTDSVIIKNPDIIENNIQNLEDFATMTHNVKQALSSTDTKPYRKGKSAWFSDSSNLSNEISMPSAYQNINNEKFVNITQTNFHEMFPLEGSKSPINLIMHSHNEEYTKCIRPSLIHCVPNKSEAIRDKNKTIDNSDDKISNLQINNICAANDFNEIPINVAINLSINSNQLDTYTSDNNSENYELVNTTETHKTEVKENYIESISHKENESRQNEKMFSLKENLHSGKLSNADVTHTIVKKNSNEFQTTNKCQSDVSVDYINFEMNNPDNVPAKKYHDVDTFTCGKISIQANLPAEVLSEIENINHGKSHNTAEVTEVNFIVSKDTRENENSSNSEKSVDSTLNKFGMVSDSNSQTLKINNPLKAMDDDLDDQLEENIENIALHIMASGNIFNNCDNDKSLTSTKFNCPVILTEPSPPKIQLLSSESSHNDDFHEKVQNTEIILENFAQSNYEDLENISKTDSNKSTGIIVVETPTNAQTAQCITDTELYCNNEQSKEYIEDATSELSQQSIFNELNVSNNLINDNSNKNEHEFDSNEFSETSKTTIIEEINDYQDVQKDFMDDSEDSLKSVEDACSLSKSPLIFSHDNRDSSKLTKTVTSNLEAQCVNDNETCKTESHVEETVQDSIELLKKEENNSDVILNENLSFKNSLGSDLKYIQAVPIESKSTSMKLSLNNSRQECNIHDSGQVSGEDTDRCNNSDLINDCAVLNVEPETLSTDKIKQQCSIGKDVSQQDIIINSDKIYYHPDCESVIGEHAIDDYSCKTYDNVNHEKQKQNIESIEIKDVVRDNCPPNINENRDREIVKRKTKELIIKNIFTEDICEKKNSEMFYDPSYCENVESNVEENIPEKRLENRVHGSPDVYNDLNHETVITNVEENMRDKITSEHITVNVPPHMCDLNDLIVKTSVQDKISKEIVADVFSKRYSELYSRSNHETLISITTETITGEYISEDKSKNILSLICEDPVTETITTTMLTDEAKVITQHTNKNSPDKMNTEVIQTERGIKRSEDLSIHYSSEIDGYPENKNAKHDHEIIKTSSEETISKVIVDADVNENDSELCSCSDDKTLTSITKEIITGKNFSVDKSEKTLSLIYDDPVTETITPNAEVITQDISENDKTNTEEMPIKRVISEDFSENYSSEMYLDTENGIAKNYNDNVKTIAKDNSSEKINVDEDYSELYIGTNHETAKSYAQTKEMITEKNISEDKSENTLPLSYYDTVIETITSNTEVIITENVINENTVANDPYTGKTNREEMPTERVITKDLSEKASSEIYVYTENDSEITKTSAEENISELIGADEVDGNNCEPNSGSNRESLKSISEETITEKNISEYSENTMSLIYDDPITETIAPNKEVIITEEIIIEAISANYPYTGKTNTEEMPNGRVISEDLSVNNSSKMHVGPENSIGIIENYNEFAKTSAEENILELIDGVNENESELYSASNHETLKSITEETINEKNISEYKNEKTLSLIYDNPVTDTNTSNTEVILTEEVITEDTSENYRNTGNMYPEEIPTERSISEELSVNNSSEILVDCEIIGKTENDNEIFKTSAEEKKSELIVSDDVNENYSELYSGSNHKTLKSITEETITEQNFSENKRLYTLSLICDDPVTEAITANTEIIITKEVITGDNNENYPHIGKSNTEEMPTARVLSKDLSLNKYSEIYVYPENGIGKTENYNEIDKSSAEKNLSELIVGDDVNENYSELCSGSNHDTLKSITEESITEKNISENKSVYTLPLICDDPVNEPITSNTEVIITEEVITGDNNGNYPYIGQTYTEEMPTARLLSEDLSVNKSSEIYDDPENGIGKTENDNEIVKSSAEENLSELIVVDDANKNLSELYSCSAHETRKSCTEEILTGENILEDKSKNIVSLICVDPFTETITSATEVILAYSNTEHTSKNNTEKMNTDKKSTERVTLEDLSENYSFEMYVDPKNGIAKGGIMSEKPITEVMIERNLVDIYDDPDYESLKINVEDSISRKVVTEDKIENNVSEIDDNLCNETIKPCMKQITEKVIKDVGQCEITNNLGHGKINVEGIAVKQLISKAVGDSSADRIYDNSNEHTVGPKREELIVQKVCMRDDFTGIYEVRGHEAVKINLEENLSEKLVVENIENNLFKISDKTLGDQIEPSIKKLLKEKGIKDVNENSFSEINNDRRHETLKINAEDVAITKLSRKDIGDNIGAESIDKKIAIEHIEDKDFSDIYEVFGHETIIRNVEDIVTDKVVVADINDIEEVSTEDINKINFFESYEHHTNRTFKTTHNKIITEVIIAEGTSEDNPDIYNNRESIKSNVYEIVPEKLITEHISVTQANDNCNLKPFINHEMIPHKIIDSRHNTNPDSTIICAESLLTNKSALPEEINKNSHDKEKKIKKIITTKSDISHKCQQKYSYFKGMESDIVQHSTSKINMGKSQQSKAKRTEDVFECCKDCMFIPKECNSNLNEHLIIKNHKGSLNINIDKHVLEQEENKEIEKQTKGFQNMNNNMHNNVDEVKLIDIMENEDILLKKQTNYNVSSNEQQVLKMLMPGTSNKNDTITSSLNCSPSIANNSRFDNNNLLLSTKENYENNSCTRGNKKETPSLIISGGIQNDQYETGSNNKQVENNEKNKTCDNTYKTDNYDILNINKYKKGIVFDTYFDNKGEGSIQSSFSSDADTFISGQMSLIKNRNRSTRWDLKYSFNKELISKINKESCEIETDNFEKIYENTESKIGNKSYTNFAHTSQENMHHNKTSKEEINTEYSDLNDTELSSCLSFIFENLSRKRRHTIKDINLTNTDQTISKNECCNSQIYPCIATNNYEPSQIVTTRTPKSSLTSMNKVAKLFLDDNETEMVKRRRMSSLENENERNINSDIYLSKWINIDKENIAKCETSIKETEIPKDMRTNQVFGGSDHCASENECCSPPTEKHYYEKTTDSSISLTDIFEKDVNTSKQEQKDDQKLKGNVNKLTDHINATTNTGCEKFVLYDELWTETEVSVHPKYPKIDQVSTQGCQHSSLYNSNRDQMSTSQNLEDCTMNNCDKIDLVHNDSDCNYIENGKCSTDPSILQNPKTNESLYNSNNLLNIEHEEVKQILPEDVVNDITDISMDMQVKEVNVNATDTGHCIVTNLNENFEQHELSNNSKIKTYIMPIEQIICMEPDSTQECNGYDNANITSNAICLKVSDTHNKGASDGNHENIAKNLSCDIIHKYSDTVAEKNKDGLNEELEECDSSQVYYYSNEVELYKIPQNQIHSTCIGSESHCNLDNFSENQECLLIEDECQLTDAIQLNVTHVDACEMENYSSNDFCGEVSQTTVLQLVLNSPSPNLGYAGSNNPFDIGENNTNVDCEEMWIDDVGCVETVVSENVEQESDNDCPESPSLNCSNVSTLQLSDLTKNENPNYFDSTKIKNIYGDNMDNNDIDLVERLYKTPHMDVRSKLMESECNMRPKENVLLHSCGDESGSQDVNSSVEGSGEDENGHLSTFKNKQLDTVHGLPLQVLRHDFISNNSDDSNDQDGRNDVLCERNTENENICFLSLHTKHSDLDDLSLRQPSQSVSSRNCDNSHHKSGIIFSESDNEDENGCYLISSHNKYSNLTNNDSVNIRQSLQSNTSNSSDENNVHNSMTVSRKSDNEDETHYPHLPQYKHSESNNRDKSYKKSDNFPRRKNYADLNLLHNIHTDVAPNVYVRAPKLKNSVHIQETSTTPICEMPYSNRHFRKTDKLITKAAQKYVPPLKISAQDFKVQLSLSEERLKKLKLLKINPQQHKRSPIPKLKISTSQIQKNNSTQKLKPNFDDVLKNIDAAQYKLKMKYTNKKNLNCIPKVIIKKQGSHYTSTSPAVKDEFNPDLTGDRWQPWVSLERCIVIDKMIARKKTKVVISSPSGHFTQQKGFRARDFRMKSQYSIDSIKEKPLKCMIMVKPKCNKINIPKSTQI